MSENIDDLVNAARSMGGGSPFGDEPTEAPDMQLDLSPTKKREVLEWLIKADRKYRLPFTQGRLGVFSIIGTKSWSEYAGLVLNIMLLDSLLNIEEQLARITDGLGHKNPDSASHS